MSENKITTNKIEEALLKKKQKEFREELEAAIGNLDKVLYKYCHSLKQEDLKEFVSWFAKNAMTIGLPLGTPSMICTNLYPGHYPERLNEQLLKMAVDEFLKSFDQAKEQLEEIYGSINI